MLSLQREREWRSSTLPQGTYSEEEKEAIRNAARLIASGQRKLSDVAREIADTFGRPYRGVQLYLGRAVRSGEGNQRARRRVSRMSGEPHRRRRSLERIIAETQERAAELRRLRDSEAKISRRIGELEGELQQLQAELLERIGLTTLVGTRPNGPEAADSEEPELMQ
jgi:hypothetical protein